MDRFARPSARVAYGKLLVGRASAAIDLSDGLAGDLGKLLAASGVGGEIELDRLPLSAALRETYTPDEQRRFALSGGDDYELCFTSSQEPPDPGIMPLTRIGTVIAGAGLVARFEGRTAAVDDPGYRHFS